jgi:hypothetical protein
MNPLKISKSHLEKALLDVFSLPHNEINLATISDAVFETDQGKPYESTLDLVQLYAANLRNGGAPAGPNSRSLGIMTRWVFSSAGFTLEDKLVRFDKREFSHLSAEFVRTQPLSKSGGVDNEKILRAIASGLDAQLKNKLLSRIVDSIEKFSIYLIEKHSGSAISFANQFAVNIDAVDAISMCEDASRFRERLFAELKFPLMGPAITSNLLKDSQIGRALAIRNLSRVYLGALAKPDMHVMRFMLAITGRVSIQSEADLTNLCHEDNFYQIYNKQPPDAGWPVWGDDSSGEEKCLRDINYLSFSNDYSSIFLDRILFIAGSGRCDKLIQSKKINQRSRYHRFLESLELLIY